MNLEHEFSIHFRHTVGWYNNHLFHAKSADYNDEDRLAVYGSKLEHNERGVIRSVSVNYDLEQFLETVMKEFNFPETGMFNYSYGAFYFYRLGSRQWKLWPTYGTNESNFRLHNISQKSMWKYSNHSKWFRLRNNDIVSITSDYRFFWNLYNRSVLSIFDAIELVLRKKRASATINKEFGIGLLSLEEDFLGLYKRGSLIGIFENEDTIKVPFNCLHLTEQIEELGLTVRTL